MKITGKDKISKKQKSNTPKTTKFKLILINFSELNECLKFSQAKPFVYCNTAVQFLQVKPLKQKKKWIFSWPHTFSK